MDRNTILALFAVLFIGTMIAPAYAESSSREQLKNDTLISQIQCNEEKTLMQSPVGKPVCVFDATSERLVVQGWSIIQLVKPIADSQGISEISGPTPEPEIIYFDNGYNEIQYHENGNLKSSKYYYEDGQLEVEVQYDQNDNLKSHKYYDKDGQLKKESYYEYDQNSNLKSEKHYENGQLDEESYYEYDQNSNLKSEKHYENGQLDEESHYEYDQNDNLKSHKYYDKDGQLKKNHTMNTIKTAISNQQYNMMRMDN